jgi:hypothetical protein
MTYARVMVPVDLGPSAADRIKLAGMDWRFGVDPGRIVIELGRPVIVAPPRVTSMPGKLVCHRLDRYPGSPTSGLGRLASVEGGG